MKYQDKEIIKTCFKVSTDYSDDDFKTREEKIHSILKDNGYDLNIIGDKNNKPYSFEITKDNFKKQVNENEFLIIDNENNISVYSENEIKNKDFMFYSEYERVQKTLSETKVNDYPNKRKNSQLIDVYISNQNFAKIRAKKVFHILKKLKSDDYFKEGDIIHIVGYDGKNYTNFNPLFYRYEVTNVILGNNENGIMKGYVLLDFVPLQRK